MTEKQRKYYFGVMLEHILTECSKQGIKMLSGKPITKENLHYSLKKRFLPLVIEEMRAAGEDEKEIPSAEGGLTTTTLAAKAFGQYYARLIQQHFALFDISIPDPNEEQMMGCYGKKIINKNQGERPCLNPRASTT